MAGNQREIQRRERKAQKDKKNKKIIWIAIAIIIAILGIMKAFEINFDSVKLFFSNGFFSFSSSVDGNYPYNLDSSNSLAFTNVNNKLGVLTQNSFTVIDSKNGNATYSFDHRYSNPVFDNSGAYFILYDQGANSLRLDTTTSNVYETTLDHQIHCAAVAKNGSVAYATTSSEKKSQIVIVNKSLKKTLTYDESYGYVVAIAINDNGKKIAFACVNSEDAKLKFKLYTMSAGDEKPTAEIDLPQGNILDLKYSSKNIFVIGDNYAGIITGQKNYQDIYKSGEINTAKFTYTPSNELLLVYNDYVNSVDNTMVRIKSNGKIRNEGKISGTVKCISSSSNVVSVLTTDHIFSYKLSNLEQTQTYNNDDSVKAICQMGSQIYVHRQSLIDRNGAKN